MNVPDRSRVEWIRVITEFWRWTGRPRNLLRTYREIPICIVNIAALGGAKGRRMDDATMQRLQELSDREAIRDCLNRYARGLDRRDLDMLRSAFHPDATDHHGGHIVYHPAADALIADWQQRDADRAFSQHLIINTSIELDGDTAHGETYFQLLTGLDPDSRPESPRLSASGGRYVDRFERRDGEWRIAHRVVVVEYSMALDAIDRPHHLLFARRDATDPSYARPLMGPHAVDQS